MATKTPYQALAQRYFALCGVIRKQFAGNGKDTSNAAAEALIVAGTIRMDGSNSINMKASVAALKQLMNDAGISKTEEVAA